MTEEGVGERIRRLRLERGTSQRKLAERGISATFLSHIENGKRRPSVRALRLLAPKLGVSVEYLERGFDTEELERRLVDAEIELRLDDSSAAAARFREIVEAARARGDAERLQRAQIGLGLAAANEGRHGAAVAELEAALGLRRPPVGERPDLYAVLGRCYAATGEGSRAVVLFRRCLEEIERADPVDDALFIRFATYLSYALTDIGDRTGASLVLARAMERIENVPDFSTQARVTWSLARLYGVQGPPELAFSYYRRTIALLETTDEHLYLGRACEAYASALLDDGRYEEVRPYLERAERIYLAEGRRPYLGALKTEWARLMLQAGDLEAARALALESLDLLDEAVTEAYDTGLAWRTLGDIFARMDEGELAEKAYKTAIEKLEAGAALKYLADACQSYANFLQKTGRDSEALEYMKRTLELTRTPPQRVT